MTQNRVGADRGQQRCTGRGERPVRPARQNRGKVEPEAVDTHLGDPISQAVKDQRRRANAGASQCVPTACVVTVRIRRIARHHVVGGVVNSPETVDRSAVPPFGGVVVDNVEDDFDARFMKGADHRAKLVAGIPAKGGVLAMRREEVQRHVAPVVAFLRVELLDGLELDHRDDYPTRRSGARRSGKRSNKHSRPLPPRGNARCSTSCSLAGQGDIPGRGWRARFR